MKKEGVLSTRNKSGKFNFHQRKISEDTIYKHIRWLQKRKTALYFLPESKFSIYLLHITIFENISFNKILG
jgi:hypothetical protein